MSPRKPSPPATTLPVALVTGFEPFEGATVNPSLEIARALDGRVIAGHRVVGAGLPTAFAAAPAALRTLLRTQRPALVIALGLASGRRELGLERIAVNLVDARIADNAGSQPVDVAVIRGAPAAYFTSLPVKAMRARLEAAHIPAVLSQSAGLFVCNQVFYVLAHALAREGGSTRGGFIHVPPLRAGTSRKGLSLRTLVRGIALCVEVAATTRRDARVAGGSIA